MTEDAMYIIDLFHLQLGSIKWELLDKAIRPEKFDSYSFSAWAIQELLDAIKEYDGLLTVEVIIDLLNVQKDMYGGYYNNNTKTQKRFKYALNMVESLIKIAGGCV